MAFSYKNSKGQTYYLHGREVELNNDRRRTIYFFAKEPRDGALDSVPEGWQVMEGRNALPVLAKENGQRGSENGKKGGSSRSNSGQSSSAQSKSRSRS